MLLLKSRLATILLGGLLATCPITQAALQTFEHSNVLGTSYSLTIDASSAAAKAAEQASLKEIQRLEQIYSSYDKQSELSRINASSGRLHSPASTEFIHMIELCQRWQQQLPMAFSCRLGDVIAAWKNSEKLQARPDRKAIRAIARRALYSEYQLVDLNNGKAPAEFSWDFGAIAKGFIIDRAFAAALEAAPQASAIGVDIGGDSRFWQADKQQQPWQIKLARPDQIDDSRENMLGTISSHAGAIAYSGHRSRALKIGRHSYSHIVKPRDGWPKDSASSAIVLAHTASRADALATALASMDIGPALDWVNKQANTEALLIDSSGRQYASANWYQNYSTADASTALAEITFVLAKIRSGNYRKPYVAIWLEDNKHKVIKNLLLLGDSERWMTKNSYWWRRQGRAEPELLQIFSRPTRRAGEYQLLWHGRDDFGQPVIPGQYQLIIEAAREHGGHEKIGIPFVLGTPSKYTAKGPQEIQSLTLDIKPSPHFKAGTKTIIGG